MLSAAIHSSAPSSPSRQGDASVPLSYHEQAQAALRAQRREEAEFKVSLLRREPPPFPPKLPRAPPIGINTLCTTTLLSLTLSSLALLAQDGFDVDVFNQAKASAEAGFVVQKAAAAAATCGGDGEGGDEAENGDGVREDRGSLPPVLGTPSPSSGDDAGRASLPPSRASPPGTTRGDAPPNSPTLAGLSSLAPLAPLSQEGFDAASKGVRGGACGRLP